MAKNKDTDALAVNRKARFNYEIVETFEAGISLTGTEIKSVRNSQITIADGYVTVRGNVALLQNVHIAPYKEGNQFNVDPLRNRQLLLHKKELRTLREESQLAGMAIVPLKVYLKNGFAKVLIGLARGKKLYDKRETIKKRDQERELQRKFKR